MKLILVRHGQTKENKEDIFQGHSEGQLNDKGKEQVRKLAKKLEQENIDIIYCSDLQRTRNTIKPFLENNNTPIHYVKDLRERNIGVLEGLKLEEIKDYLEKNKTNFDNSNFETGETFYDVKKRVVTFYNSVVDEHKNDTVLFVTHGGTIVQLILYLFNHPIDKFLDFLPDNATITKIEIEDGKLKLLIFNDAVHL